jgi:hypothetical protein
VSHLLFDRGGGVGITIQGLQIRIQSVGFRV